MRIFRTFRIVVALTCGVITTPLFAQIGSDGVLTRPGLVVSPSERVVPLRDSTPGFLGLLGRESGQTTDHSMYLILEEQQVPFFFTHDSWIRVAPIDGRYEGETHWAYWGRSNSTSSQNFTPVTNLDIGQRNSLAEWYLEVPSSRQREVDNILAQWGSILNDEERARALPALQPWYDNLDGSQRTEITNWYASLTDNQVRMGHEIAPWFPQLPDNTRSEMSVWFSDLKDEQGDLVLPIQSWYHELGLTKRTQIAQWYASLYNREREILPLNQRWYQRLEIDSQNTVAEWYARFVQNQSNALPARQSWYPTLTEDERRDVVDWYSNLVHFDDEKPQERLAWMSRLDETTRSSLSSWFDAQTGARNSTVPFDEWYDNLDDGTKQDVTRWKTELVTSHLEALPEIQTWFFDTPVAERVNIAEWYSQLTKNRADLPLVQPWYNELNGREKNEIAKLYFGISRDEAETLPAGQPWYYELDETRQEEITLWYNGLLEDQQSVFAE